MSVGIDFGTTNSVLALAPTSGDVLARIADHPAKRIAELLPWNWKAVRQQPQA